MSIFVLLLAFKTEAQSNTSSPIDLEKISYFPYGYIRNDTIYALNPPGGDTVQSEDKPQVFREEQSHITTLAYDPKLYGSCVQYAKAQTGFSQSIGEAKYWPITGPTPEVGDIVITAESSAGHVAVIMAISSETLILTEANYIPNTLTSGRRLNINSPLIIGYWSPPHYNPNK